MLEEIRIHEVDIDSPPHPDWPADHWIAVDHRARRRIYQNSSCIPLHYARWTVDQVNCIVMFGGERLEPQSAEWMWLRENSTAKENMQAWASVFYPCNANSEMVKVDAEYHSLRKWIGYKEKYLKLFNGEGRSKGAIRTIAFRRGALVPDCVPEYTEIEPDASNCALCVWFRDLDNEQDEHECSKCPLYQLHYKTCYSNRGKLGAYAHWYHTGEPERLIEDLFAVYLKRIRAPEDMWEHWKTSMVTDLERMLMKKGVAL